MTHIILVGFMGTGKSSVGKILASLRRRPFYDLDRLIEKGETQTIPAIIQDEGIAGFRHIESVYLESVLAREPGVVATGGGAVLSAENRAQLVSHRVVVLTATPQTLLQRLEKTWPRPLLRELTETSIVQRLNERLPAYNMYPLQVATDGLSPEQVADRICERLAI